MRKNLGPRDHDAAYQLSFVPSIKGIERRGGLGGMLRACIKSGDSWPQSQIFTGSPGSPSAVTGDTDEKLGVCSSPSAATVCSLW